jgi:hypothetical protein
MRYRTPEALEMAVRDAAKASPQDTNRAIAGFYFNQHREIASRVALTLLFPCPQ